jgi:predicted SAM-dependent methyltransferase
MWSGERVRKLVSAPTITPTKLDLACGQRKREGFYGVDVAATDDADLVHDLSVFPWPFDDDSVEEVFSSHYVEHTYPVGGPNDGLIAFMNEVWRICKHEARVEIVHPYALSTRAFQDPTHTRFIPETTWNYFTREWMVANGLDHYPITADFEVRGISNGFHSEWNLRSEPARTWAAAHYWNVVSDLVVDLRAIKE